jgi:broad specificity phosphatase PhoE
MIQQQQQQHLILGRTKASKELLSQEYDFFGNNIVHDNINTTSVQQENCHNEPISTDTYKVRYDPRLREIARGLREGLPKEYSYEEATDIYKNRKHPPYNRDNKGNSNNNSNDVNTTETRTTMPALETDDDAWNRIYTL